MALVAAFLMLERGATLKQALDAIREARPQASPNAGTLKIHRNCGCKLDRSHYLCLNCKQGSVRPSWQHHCGERDMSTSLIR